MAGPDERDDFAGWLRLLERRWRTGLVAFVVLFGLAAAIIFLSRPVYRAEARLRVGDPPPATGVTSGGGFLGFFRLGGDPFANDLEVLKSRTVAERVVQRAALNVALAAPRGWHRDSLFEALAADTTTERARFAITWRGPDTVAVRMTAPEDSLVGVQAAGRPVAFGGLSVVFRARREGMPREVTLRTLPFGEAVRRTRRRIAVSRVRRDANVMEATFDHTDPRVAHAAVAAAVDAFVALRSSLHRREAGTTTDSLRTVADRTRAELAAAETTLSAYQRGRRVVAPRAQSEELARQYAALSLELDRAESERATVDDLLRRAAADPDSSTAWTRLVSHPTFLANQTLGELLAELIRLQRHRTALAARRTPASQELQVVEAQLAGMDRALRLLVRGYRDGLEQRIAELERRTATLDSVVAAAPAAAIELGRREREVRTLGEIAVFTEQRLRQEALREALTFANVQVIDPPALRYRPVWPRKTLGLGLGFLLAGLFAVLTMIVRDRADRAVRSAGDVLAAAGAPVLAVAVRQDGRISPAPADVVAALRRAAGEALPGRPVVVPVGDASVGDAVLAAFDGAAQEVPLLARPVRSFADAVAATRQAAPVVLALALGATRRDDVRRVAGLLREAGGTLGGVIVVVPSEGEADHVWA